jgi:hypothetical protein
MDVLSTGRILPAATPPICGATELGTPLEGAVCDAHPDAARIPIIAVAIGRDVK